MNEKYDRLIKGRNKDRREAETRYAKQLQQAFPGISWGKALTIAYRRLYWKQCND